MSFCTTLVLQSCNFRAGAAKVYFCYYTCTKVATPEPELPGDRRGRGSKNSRFLRFLRFPHGPLRGWAWSRCKVVEVQKLKVFTISAVPARPSAGIGVVEVQKLKVFTISADPAPK